MSLRNALGGSVLLNWTPSREMTKWDGITLSGTPQRVTKIDLANRGLSGRIPPGIGRLISLQSLTLSQNSLSGGILAELGDLAQLQSLRLDRNRLTGAIPPELQKLGRLEALFLAGHSFSGCIPIGLRAIASNDLASIEGVDYCPLVLGTPTATTVTVTVPVSVQTTMINDELAHAEARLTALQALLADEQSDAGVSGQGSDATTQIQFLITSLKAKILSIKKTEIEQLTDYDVELPIVEVQHNGIAGIAFSQFSYALNEEDNLLVEKDPINFLFWGTATSSNFKKALSDHSRPTSEVPNPYRWKGDHGLFGNCDLGQHQNFRDIVISGIFRKEVKQSPFQYVLMRNTAGEWKWAKSKGLQGGDAPAMACHGAERHHLRYWPSDDNNLGERLGDDPHLGSWTIVAAHYDENETLPDGETGHKPDFDRGERRAFQSIVTPLYRSRGLAMPWVLDLRERVNLRNALGADGGPPQGIRHDGLGSIVRMAPSQKLMKRPGVLTFSVEAKEQCIVVSPNLPTGSWWFDILYCQKPEDASRECGSVQEKVDNTGSNAVVSGLERGATYEVAVVAFNGRERFGSENMVVTLTKASVTIDSGIAGDGTVNIAEKASGFDITGTAEAGADVTLTLDSSRAADTITVKATQDGTWSVSIPGGARYVTEGERTILATARKTGRVDGKASVTIEVDLTRPSVSYVFPATLRVGDVVDKSPSTHGHRDIKTFEEKPGAPLPKSLRIDSKTGRIFGTLTEANRSPGSFIVVTDEAGNSTEKALTIPAIVKVKQVLTGFRYVPTLATLGATAPTVHAPTGAKGTLSYASDDASICTVDRATGVPTMRGVGKCTVTVTAAATVKYESATDEASFRIAPRAITPPPPELTCPRGQHLVGGVCEPIPPTCSASQDLVDGKCVPKCDSDQHRVNGVCVPIPPQPCPTGEHRVNGVCVPIPCSAGQERVDGKCVTKCDSDEHRVGGVCVPKPCPEGQERVGTVCLPEIPPEPSTRIVNLPSEFRTESRTTINFTSPSFCVERTLNRVVQVSVRSITTYSLVNRRWVGSTRIVRRDVSHGPWRVVSTQPCNFPALRGETGFLLPAGDYVLEWGETQYGFTVPVGATVTLDGRLESGKYVAVFRQGEEELAVTPQTLSGVSGQAAPQDSTLAVVSASLTEVTPGQPDTTTTTEHQCAVAAEGDQSATAVNLDTEHCLVVRDGGTIKVSRGGDTRSLILPAGRDWLLAGTIGKEATPAIAIVDLTTGGYLIIKAEDGSELRRSLGDGGAALGILFDALAPATPASGEN